VGISPIEYRRWKGDRTPYSARLLTVAERVVRCSLRKKSVLVLMVLGVLLVHVFPLISTVLSPHEDADRNDRAKFIA